MQNTKSIPANRIPLTDHFKKLKDSLYLRSHKEHREEKGEVENHSVEHEGNIIGNVTTHDGEIVEHQASADMQETGQDEKVASKVGGKSAPVVKTKASRAAEQSSDSDQMKPKASKDTPGQKQEGFKAEKVELTAPDSKETSKEGKAKGGKVDNSLFKPAKGKTGSMKPEEGDFKAEKKSTFKVDDSQSTPAKKETKTSKPDNSMSKMASQESAETQGSELNKSDPVELKLHPKLRTTQDPVFDKETNTLTYGKPRQQAPAQKPAPSPEQKQQFQTQLQSARYRAGVQEKKYQPAKQSITKKPGQEPLKESLDDRYKISKQAAAMDKSEDSHKQGGWKSLFSAARGSEPMAKAGPAAPKLPPPAAPKAGKMDEKKQQLVAMARMGKEKPLTSTPLGHALANYTDPNSFSFDPRFAALITRMAPAWAKKK